MHLRVILADSHGVITGKDQNSPNLGLLYLASYARAQGVDAEFEYISQIHTVEHHLERIRSWRPHVYAVSFTSYAAPRTYHLINSIKRAFPDVQVICGGAHPTVAYEDVLQKSYADAVCISEGEATFVEYLGCIARGALEEVRSVAGLALHADGCVVKTPERPAISNLDDIPFPARDLVHDTDFAGLTYRKATPTTGMSVTRGCPFRCTFCATQYRYQHGPLYRARSPENIAAEAAELYRAGYREIYLYADEINLSLQWTISVCKALAGLGHRDLYFQCNFRCEPINEEVAVWLKRANIWMVHFGIESSSNRVLTGIKKVMSRDKTERACRLLSEGGIKVFAFLMMYNYWEDDGKLEHETSDEVRETIRFIYKLFLKRQVHYCTWIFAIPVPGAEMYDVLRRHGVIDGDYYPSDTWESYKHLRNVSREEFNRLYARGRRQQAIFAAVTGNIEWRNWRAIRHKLHSAFFGQVTHESREKLRAPIVRPSMSSAADGGTSVSSSRDRAKSVVPLRALRTAVGREAE
jgi:anaerobic magnesium-protoporphyrin IX monomethyl ester cyclase